MTLTESSFTPLQSDPGYDIQDIKHNWDINDTVLPKTMTPDAFNEWPNGHSRHVYAEENDESRRHISGWAMRNTNNHNVNILKKSCLGVLVCNLQCTYESGKKVHIRPAICDKARRKQLGRKCPNPTCNGGLELMPCRGHCGYPVTHFWRHCNGLVYFQAKGVHDHPRPEVKTTAEARRHAQNGSRSRYMTIGNKIRRPRKRSVRSISPCAEESSKFQRLDDSEKEVICSCPPFECTCSSSMHMDTPFADTKPAALWHYPTSETSAFNLASLSRTQNETNPTGSYLANFRDQSLLGETCAANNRSGHIINFESAFHGLHHIPSNITDSCGVLQRQSAAQRSGYFRPSHGCPLEPTKPIDISCGHEPKISVTNQVSVCVNTSPRTALEIPRNLAYNSCHYPRATDVVPLPADGLYQMQSQTTESRLQDCGTNRFWDTLISEENMKSESFENSFMSRTGMDCLHAINTEHFLPQSDKAITRLGQHLSHTLHEFSPIGNDGHREYDNLSPCAVLSRQASPVESTHSLRPSPPLPTTPVSPTVTEQPTTPPHFTELQPIKTPNDSIGLVSYNHDMLQDYSPQNSRSATESNFASCSNTNFSSCHLANMASGLSESQNHRNAFESRGIIDGGCYNSLTSVSGLYPSIPSEPTFTPQCILQPFSQGQGSSGHFQPDSYQNHANFATGCVPFSQQQQQLQNHSINITLTYMGN